MPVAGKVSDGTVKVWNKTKDGVVDAKEEVWEESQEIYGDVANWITGN